MTPKKLTQIVAYISPDLKALIEQDRKRSAHRVSMSAYIEGILRGHFQQERKKKGAA